MNILGVRIDEETAGSAVLKIQRFFQSDADKKYTIFTPNPEMLVDAQSDPYFLDVLNTGSLNLCDGRGVEMVGCRRLVRIPGVDFVLRICADAEKNGRSIFLMGTKDVRILEKTQDFLKTCYPTIRIVGMDCGVSIVTNRKTDQLQYNLLENESILEKINNAKPDFLLVAFGHGKQEKWIAENLMNLNVKVCMGVGGAFDFFSGKVRRAPRLLRRFGLEWLWRLFIQPSRIGRIYKATFQFLYYYVKSKYKKTSR